MCVYVYTKDICMYTPVNIRMYVIYKCVCVYLIYEQTLNIYVCIYTCMYVYV